MSQYDEPPPPYEAAAAVETTPLRKPSARQTQRHTRLCLIGFVACLVIGFVFAWYFNAFSKEKIPHAIVRVAVIGAGPAGVSAAFTLSELTRAKGIEVNITIFEGKNGVGGRMLLNGSGAHRGHHFATLSLEDAATGNLLHNRILRERDAKSLRDGYGKNWKNPRQSSSVGFFDGERIISVATRPVDTSTWGEWLGRIFRYGSSVWRAKNLPVGTMNNFQNLLDLEETYEDVGAMLAASQNAGPVARTASERLKLNGISQEYIRDVLGPQIRRHSGQGVDEVSDLALSIALDREDQGIQISGNGGRLTSVLKGFVKKSKANLHLSTQVSGLRRERVEGEESWIVQYSGQESQAETIYEAFDKVIIAAPWNTSSLLTASPEEVEQVQYRSQWLTLFISNATLNSNFGNPSTLPSQIALIHTSKLPSTLHEIQDITHLRDIAAFDPSIGKMHQSHLYRIVSGQKIDHSAIYPMLQGFEGIQTLEIYQERIEHAYPLLHARTDGFPSFKVADGLWHTNVLESIGSYVDLSWIAGENVARLVGKDIEQDVAYNRIRK